MQREAAEKAAAEEAARGEDDSEFRVYMEGHNQTHCYRATVEPTRMAGARHVDTKMRVAAAWLGDKKTAQRETHELRNGDQRRLLNRGGLKVVANTGEIIAPK